MAADKGPQGGQLAAGEHDQLTRLGKYVIQKRLGAGGMGTVFLALDQGLNRTVALKVLPKDRAENPVLVKRFQAEGQAAAHLQHKNIVGVYEAGEIDGFLYIALEYIDGTDVLNLIRKRGAIPVRRSVEMMRQVTEALQHAFEKQIVHRDIKPSNLLVKKDGTIKLADLGLARSVDENIDTSITRAGTTVGTVDYMAPEQARNSKAADIRSDIYSLGCTWFHMLTGVPPYGEGSLTNKLQAHASGPLPDPRQWNERVPEGIVAVIHRMMAKKPDDRHQTPAELLDDLNNAALMRTGLNTDVLAALADDAGASPDESTSSVEVEELDALERQPGETPFRVDATMPPGSARRRPAPPRESPDEPEPPPAVPRSSSARKKPPVEPPRSHKLSDTRELPGEPDDAWKSAPYQRKQADSGRHLPPRSAVPESKSKDRRAGVEKGAKSRSLPPRGDQPILSEPPKAGIDPEKLKIGFAVLLVAVILGGLGYAFSRTGGVSAPSATGENPYMDSSQAAGAESLAPEETQTGPMGDVPPEDGNVAIAVDPATSQVAANRVDPARANLRSSAPPLAGAEGLDPNSESGLALMEDWLFRLRSEGPTAAPAIVVARGSHGEDRVPTLSDAMSKLSAGAAIIEFEGDGPFTVSPLELSARPQLILRARGESRPVVVLTTSGLAEGQDCLSFGGEKLVLENLHLIVAADPATPVNVAMIGGPGVWLRNCTLTQAGETGTPLTALRLRKGQRGVMENCVVRGPALTACQLEDRAARFVAGNCFLESGEAPCVSLKGASVDKVGVDGQAVTLLGVTTFGAGEVFRLKAENATGAFNVRLACRRGLFLAKPGGETTWLTVSPWPAVPTTDLESPLASGLTWQGEQVSLAGWNRLVHFQSGAGGSQDIRDDAGWKQFWRQSASTINLSGAAVSVADSKLPAAPDVIASALQAASLAGAGCDVTRLPVVPEGLLQRVLAVASRARLAPGFISDRSLTPVVTFDLSKAAGLNMFLNDPQRCPDGAHVELRGAGFKNIPPLKIQNKSLRLEFIQTEGAPLLVRPLVSGSGPAAEAWIVLDGGALDLVGARMQLPDADRQPFPPHLIKVTSGDLALRSSFLTGPTALSNRPGSVISWSAGAPGSMLIEDSLLIGRGAIVDADLSQRLLEVRNSVLASIDDVFRLTAGSDDSQRGTLAVQESSLANGQAAVRIHSPDGQPAMLSLFLSHVVYAPTFSAPGQSPVVAALSSEDAGRGVQWWEDGIGYGPQLQQALTVAGQPRTPIAELPGAWEARWGAGHVLRSLTDPLGVSLDRPLSEPDKIEPSAFELSQRCAAATWHAKGGAIGARLVVIGPQKGASPVPASETKPAAAPGRTPTKRVRPNF